MKELYVLALSSEIGKKIIVGSISNYTIFLIYCFFLNLYKSQKLILLYITLILLLILLFKKQVYLGCKYNMIKNYLIYSFYIIFHFILFISSIMLNYFFIINII